MVSSFSFWLEHPGQEAMKIARRHLGEALLYDRRDVFAGHHFWHFGYLPDFDLTGVERLIRKELDEIDWLFITTGLTIEYKHQTLSTFGIAPILPMTLTVGYHATRICLIPRILEEGLLPSNAERRATHYPDTEGVIHVWEKLTKKGDENDSAEWWMGELSKKNKFDDPNWGIVRIDMSRLPATARTYQDMHSFSGVIVDRVERISAELIVPIE
jgi:hypothetical protein